MEAREGSHVAYLHKLHPSFVADSQQILGILRDVLRRQVPLTRGLNRAFERESLLLTAVDLDALELSPQGTECSQVSGEFLLGFALDGRSYYFATHKRDRRAEPSQKLIVSFPSTIFVGERRDRLRRRRPSEVASGWHAVILGPAGERWSADIEDLSPGGLGIVVSAELPVTPGQDLALELAGAGEGTHRVDAEVRYLRPDYGGKNLVKLGVRLGGRQHRAFREIDARATRDPLRVRVRSRAGELVAGARLVARRRVGARAEAPRPEVVEFHSGAGERIVGLIDSVGNRDGAPAVIVPPAWGKTKETLLPLARTLVAVFEKAHKDLVVLRFDGIRRRGESDTDPWCRVPGREHHSFSVSQGVRDIGAAAEFLRRAFRSPKVVLVTFSASAIEGRRAVAENPTGAIAGWVPVVGPPDLQSAMKVVSGGLDYLAGAERGLKFGMREVLGIEIDVDRASADAIEHKLGFLEDAFRDFSNIEVPVAWIHGAYDGWMDLARVRQVLSCGRQDNRKLIIVPTGHQLRSSRQALDVFTRVGAEIAEMIGFAAERAVPDLVDMDARRSAERARLPERKIDLGAFWRDYLLGRNGHVGMSLMTEAPSYMRLMERQVDLLELGAGDRVADLGSGLGAFARELGRRLCPPGLAVIEIDLVSDALKASGRGCDGLTRYAQLSADLSSPAGQAVIPLASDSCSAVLASLLISYVKDPRRLLREALRILRPGGRLVVSTLKRDADLSLIWAENEMALRASGLVDRGESELDEALRSFFNDASRLMLLEEDGFFAFWEPDELADIVRECGFERVACEMTLGDPPQAVLVSGRRG